VYSNTEEVELYQNGRSLGRKKVNPDTYQAIYLVDYKKGELKADAYSNDKIVANHILKTAGDPEKLVLKDEKLTGSYEGDELIFLVLEVQDRKGIRCPHARNEVSVEIEGTGELIGLDSGDQFSHELYKQNQRKAYEGRLLLTIRPKRDGELTVKCKSPGLKAAEMTINK